MSAWSLRYKFLFLDYILVWPPCPSALVAAPAPASPLSLHQGQGGSGEGRAGGRDQSLPHPMVHQRGGIIIICHGKLHLNAAAPRPRREEIPKAKTEYFRFHLNQYAQKTHLVVTYGELGKSYNDGLASDLKSSKLIFPSPSWSRSANMISLSPWVGSIYNTPTCWSSVSIHDCSDAVFDENFSLSLYTGWGPLKKHTVCVGSVTWPLLQHSGFHPNCQHHDNFLFLRKLFHKKRTFWQKILQKGSIRRKVPPRRHKVSLSKPR